MTSHNSENEDNASSSDEISEVGDTEGSNQVLSSDSENKKLKPMIWVGNLSKTLYVYVR